MWGGVNHPFTPPLGRLWIWTKLTETKIVGIIINNCERLVFFTPFNSKAFFFSVRVFNLGRREERVLDHFLGTSVNHSFKAKKLRYWNSKGAIRSTKSWPAIKRNFGSFSTCSFHATSSLCMEYKPQRKTLNFF